MNRTAQPITLAIGDTHHVLADLQVPPEAHAGDERAKHLFEVQIPMLFLQGTRDQLADLTLLQPLARKLGARAMLKLFEDADHSFHVPARTGRKDAEVMDELADALARWIDATIARASG